MDPILSLILTGGEPYLRHDLDQIVRIFYENAKIPIITIPSNGWYLKKMDKQIRNMMEWCPNLTLNQQISIDGIGADHNAIRMKQQIIGSDNSFEKAVKTINHLKILQKIYHRINIGIIITFTNQNQNKFKNITKQIYSLVKPDNISINLVRGNPKQKVNLDLDLELYREAVKYRDNLFYENAKIPIITIPSNGWYLKKMDKQIKNMMEWCPNLTLNQQISIDGIGADHNAIRMEQQVVGFDGSFEKAVKTINHLKILQKIYDRINIGIIITFTNQNQNKFKNIVKQIYSLVEPDNIHINLVRGNPKQKVNLNLDLELYREAVKYRDNLFYEKKMSGLSRFIGNKFATAGRIMLNELVIKTYEENKYNTPCYAANLSGVMYPEGDVYPCEMLDNSHRIGNIRDFDLNFKKLWLSHKAKEDIKFIRKTRCFCTHECFNSVNIFFNPKFYLKIIKKYKML